MLSKIMKQNGMYGFGILLASAFFYASYGVFSKIIGSSFAPFTQAWTRGIISLICFLIFGLITKAFIKIKKEDIKWFLLIWTIGALAIAPTFYSLANLHIGTALFIQYAATVITSYLIGVLFLKEKLLRTNLLSLVIAFIGLFLVYWGDIYFNKFIPVLAAIISGSFFSIWFSFSKKISSKYPTIELNTLGYIFAVIMNLLIALVLREKFNTDFVSKAWLANIAYGVAGFLGSGLTIYGFKYIDAHKGSIVLLSEIIFGALFGIILFKELLSLTTIIGGALIIFSIALPNIKSGSIAKKS